jgi:ElaB/YqjD/DUF883 family membrane-anchored ribosome-binding protein
MAETDQILNHIEAQRKQLGNDFEELQQRVRREADWRTQFDRHPWFALGLALGGGLLLSAMLPRFK